MRRRTSLFERWRNALFGPATPALDLSGEVEAFLNGTYPEILERRGEPVPAWAWINPLAHGGLDDVRRLADMAEDDGPQEFVAGLARALLDQLRERQVSLDDIQRNRLIPLELALAGDRLHRFPRSGAHLARLVEATLQRGLHPIDPAGLRLGRKPGED